MGHDTGNRDRNDGKRPALIKVNVNFPEQMLADLELLEELTGRNRSELLRAYASTGIKDDLDFHLLKKAATS